MKIQHGSRTLLTSCRLDLVPSRVFQDRLPYTFVKNYIHWYDHLSDEVIFRPRQSPWTSNDDTWYLKHVARTKSWRLVRGSGVLVALGSASAGILARIFRPLEVPQHIHVLFDITTQTVGVRLPRLRLDFHIDHGCDAILSRQFRGMAIDNQQSIGALIGLTSKLVLKNAQSERMVMIPVPKRFSALSINWAKTSGTGHVTVEINKDDATKVYAYDIDKDLGLITGSGDLETKLLIAYLHAVTSGCHPDPLTKLTGTETALQILESAAVRSFDLLSTRNVELLAQIATLSTRRCFYPTNERVMQQVSWTKGLSSLSQHPNFRICVEQIFDHAASMQIYYPDDEIFVIIRDARQRYSSGT